MNLQLALERITLPQNIHRKIDCVSIDAGHRRVSAG